MILHSSFVMPVMPGETPVDYASRLALQFSCSLKVFCSRIAVSRQKLLDGSPAAVDALRRACRLSDDTFVDTTFVGSEGRRVVLAGQSLSLDQVNREVLRLCPACVDEQLANGIGRCDVWARREWHILPLHVCDVHSIPMLILSSKKIDQNRGDFSRMLRQSQAEQSWRLDEMETVEESGLGHHIRKRLRGIEDGHWLSQLPLYAAIKTGEMIGTAALHGVQQAWRDLTATERFEAGRVGFDILAEGEVGLRRLFSDFQRNTVADAGSSGLRATFGRIHVSMLEWDDAAYDPLRNVLRQHIVETLPFGPGEVVLGQEVKKRRIHSARTVAPELGVSQLTAHKRLRLIGVLDETTKNLPWSQSTFDARLHPPAR
jgi:hypothetical protein